MKLCTLSIVLAASLLALVGCNENSSSRRADRPNPASISVDSSSREIVAGETITLTARTRDTYGRNANVRWTSTAGSIKTEQDGRIARVRFDEPGTYTVRAVLLVDNREEQADMVEIRVKPVG